MNILQMVQDVAGSALVNQASGFLGENKSSTQSAINAILPSLLGGLVGKTQQSGGAGAIMDLLNNNSNNLDGSMFNNLAGLFSGGESTSMLSGIGGTLLKAVLGNKVGGLVDMVSNFSGMKKSSSNSLMSMAMPLIMGMIGKQVKAKGLGLSGLTDLLTGQKAHINSAMPSGFSGAADLLGFASGAAKKATTTSTSTQTKSGGMGWMPWVLGLLALGGLFYFMKGCGAGDMVKDGANAVVETTKDAGNLVADGANAVVDGTKDAANAAGDLVKDGAGAVGDLVEGAGETLSDAVKSAREGLANLTFAAGSAGDNMYKFLKGEGGADATGVFRFSNLNFATGSSKITAQNAQEVDNLAAVLAAYPKVKIEVQGHTDNTGNADANLKLSQARADAVVKHLASKGIGAGRLTAVGYGQTSPAADNGTDEGRAQNRRIEVKIIR